MLTVVNYHYIRNEYRTKFPSIFGVTPTSFRKQLILLKEKGDFISINDLNSNQAGLGLYRNMRWFRYHDLFRYVKINPKIKTINVKNVGAIYSWDNIPKSRLSERTNEIKYSKFSHWFEIASLEKEWDNYQNGQQDSSFHVWQWLNYIQIVN